MRSGQRRDVSRCSHEVGLLFRAGAPGRSRPGSSSLVFTAPSTALPAGAGDSRGLPRASCAGPQGSDASPLQLDLPFRALSPRWALALLSWGSLTHRLSTDTRSGCPLPGTEAPFGQALPTPDHVPSSRFLPALTACSIRAIRVCCTPQPVMRFAAFLPVLVLGTEVLCTALHPRDALTPRRTPRRQPCRVTATICPLAVVASLRRVHATCPRTHRRSDGLVGGNSTGPEVMGDASTPRVSWPVSWCVPASSRPVGVARSGLAAVPAAPDPDPGGSLSSASARSHPASFPADRKRSAGGDATPGDYHIRAALSGVSPSLRVPARPSAPRNSGALDVTWLHGAPLRDSASGFAS